MARLILVGYAVGSVVESLPLSRSLHRIVISVPEMSQLTLPTAGDTAIGIYFPNVNDRTPPPMECRNGVWGYYDHHVAPPGRTYTVHLCEPAVKRLTIDFVLHGSGLGTEWVQRATLNDQVVLAHANSWYRPESRTDWQFEASPVSCTPRYV